MSTGFYAYHTRYGYPCPPVSHVFTLIMSIGLYAYHTRYGSPSPAACYVFTLIMSLAFMPTTLSMDLLPLLIFMTSHSLCRSGYAHHNRYGSLPSLLFKSSHPLC